jgi:uncharacterized protein (TIGR02996 family)
VSDEEQRLLEAIVEAPDDDAPRLVYADWLQSRGDPRGEFIQLQCQLAAAPDDERRRAIKIAENKLFAAHGKSWLEPLFLILPAPSEIFTPFKFELERGFVEEAHVTLDCIPHFAQLWQRAPLLRRLRLMPNMIVSTPIKQPRLGGLLDAPQFARLRSLEVTLGGGGNGIARDLAAASTLANLRELSLHVSVWGEGVGMFEAGAKDLVLDDEGIAALAKSPHLANVDTLLIDSNRITSAGVTAIGHGPWKLRRLDLAHNLVEPESLAASLTGPAFAQLEVLGLAGIAFDPASIGRLVRSPSLRHLRELDLEKCHLGVEGITALCEHFALPALRRLRLERNSLGDRGSIAVAECAALANLTNLEAGHNRIGQKGAAALADSPYLAKLERLTLNEPRWKPETAALFAASPTLANAKIYLGGRLMARKKTKASKGDAPAQEAPDDNAKTSPPKAPPTKEPSSKASATKGTNPRAKKKPTS